MVRRDKHMRVGMEFVQMRDLLKKRTGMHFSDREFTNGLAEFVRDEALFQHLEKRAKRRKRRGLFS